MQSTTNLTVLARMIFEANKAKGFWSEKREIGTLLMLVTSELAEALEADRKSKKSDFLTFNKLMKMESEEWSEEKRTEFFKGNFEHFIKDGFEDEIADALIRILDMCGGLGIDIDWHVEQKLKYNATREHKHGKKY